MIGSLFIVQILMYAFALWFGLYLLIQSAGKLSLRFASIGLLTYAEGLAFMSLGAYVRFEAVGDAIWYPLLMLLPAGCWFAAAYSLLSESLQARIPVRQLLIPLFLIVFLGGLIVLSGISRMVLAALPLMLALAALVWVWRAFREALPLLPLKTLFTATLFFIFGCTLLILPIELLEYELILLLVGGDLLMLGYAIGKLDAHDEGTTLLPDALRSLANSALVTGLIGSQAFIMLLLREPVQAETALLFYSILSTTIVLTTAQAAYQPFLDRAIFGRGSRVAREREALSMVSNALPRLDESLHPLALDDVELLRLTRRALSHYNDLGKLAASPLTQLPIITSRLEDAQRTDNSLERTHELRRLLAEYIARLKPYSDKPFDTGEDWRYYNVLYFPYVQGLKPYTLRQSTDSLDPAARAALAWFQECVPERTLYNWQTAAAKLIAQQLREAGQVA